MEKQNKNKKHGCFPRPDWRNEIIDALGIGFAAGAAAMAKNAAQRGTNSPFSMPSHPATRCIFWESIQMW